MRRRIAIITGTRAEYGLLYWIIKGVNEDPALELKLVVTGMHLSPEFGLTVREIEKDGFPVAERVEMLLSSDTESAISTSMGLGMIGFAKAYERLRPDIIVVLGDRFEVLAAVAASVPFRVPVAHIHGGESTEGLIDEPIRHAVTKMSHLHFTAAERYRRRVIQMGERPENVFAFGAPGIENILRLSLMDRSALSEDLGVPAGRPWGVVTYHPVTLERDSAESQITALLRALKDISGIFWIFTLPNADTEGRAITSRIEEFSARNPGSAKAFRSLGQRRYTSLLKQCAVMVGNSSSGLIEAPSFGLPVVNIGDRQRGRVKAENVIDVAECEAGAICRAVDKATSPEFRAALSGMKNPYGDGSVSARIIEALKNCRLGPGLIKKSFYELPA